VTAPAAYVAIEITHSLACAFVLVDLIGEVSADQRART
jgi:hypothetical protein